MIRWRREHEGSPARQARRAAATHMAVVRVSGARRRVDVSLLDDTVVEPGEWVLVHAGLAVSKIPEQEAQETLALLQEMSDAFLGESTAVDVAQDYAAPSSWSLQR